VIAAAYNGRPRPHGRRGKTRATAPTVSEWIAGPIRRRVALKIIKLGMDRRRVLARFDAER
jgi:hypothetical protein